MDKTYKYKAFKSPSKGGRKSKNHVMIQVHLVYNGKQDARCKARLVAGGHMTGPNTNTYNSIVVLLRAMRMMIFNVGKFGSRERRLASGVIKTAPYRRTRPGSWPRIGKENVLPTAQQKVNNALTLLSQYNLSTKPLQHLIQHRQSRQSVKFSLEPIKNSTKDSLWIRISHRMIRTILNRTSKTQKWILTIIQVQKFVHIAIVCKASINIPHF
jgi:hypothetical protein